MPKRLLATYSWILRGVTAHGLARRVYFGWTSEPVAAAAAGRLEALIATAECATTPSAYLQSMSAALRELPTIVPRQRSGVLRSAEAFVRLIAAWGAATTSYAKISMRCSDGAVIPMTAADVDRFFQTYAALTIARLRQQAFPFDVWRELIAWGHEISTNGFSMSANFYRPPA